MSLEIKEQENSKGRILLKSSFPHDWDKPFETFYWKKPQ